MKTGIYGYIVVEKDSDYSKFNGKVDFRNVKDDIVYLSHHDAKESFEGQHISSFVILKVEFVDPIDLVHAVQACILGNNKRTFKMQVVEITSFLDD